ncbi:MAG TPA: FKBP-type peptidyl-prolyl cis-trans isomerase [Bacteroidales bacterium]|nr:FKBP-type peptidyl-prolyl cis-trans isomerase [Bacteroidales bacterium]
MKIDNNKFVSITYVLKENSSSGKVIETVADSRPLNFVFGTGKLLPSFESNLLSLSKGDKFDFVLNASDAYGDRREEMMVNVPISVFEIDGKIDESICYVGNMVPMTDSSGNPLEGMINEITETHVRMDFNHPMAGVNLWFSGNVLDVREPSPDELAASCSSCSGCGSEGDSSCSCGC